jgi:hypothetical protein
MNRKGSDLGLVEILSANLLGGTENNHRNVPGEGESGAPVEILTKDAPNHSVGHYRYVSLLISATHYTNHERSLQYFCSFIYLVLVGATDPEARVRFPALPEKK